MVGVLLFYDAERFDFFNGNGVVEVLFQSCHNGLEGILRHFEPVLLVVVVPLKVGEQLILLEVLFEQVVLTEVEDVDCLSIHLERRHVPCEYGRHPV